MKKIIYLLHKFDILENNKLYKLTLTISFEIKKSNIQNNMEPLFQSGNPNIIQVQGQVVNPMSNFPPAMSYVNEIKISSEHKSASGFWNDLNKMQYENLQKWKEQLKNENVISDFVIYDDLYLLRFLRARKFDLPKTMLMFKNFLKWRIERNVDNIRENFDFNEMIQVKAVYPHSYHKTDKTGRPIYIELISKVNLDELFKVTTEDRMISYYIREYERLMKWRFPACSAVLKTPIEQSLTILDLEGIGISHLMGKTKAFLKLASDIGQDYYPEMLGTMMLLNTSFFFNAVWGIIKVFIDEKTRKKINFLGYKYQAKLLEFVDAENLPSIIGGSCTCPHINGGCLYSDIGPWNPRGGVQVGNMNTFIGNP